MTAILLAVVALGYLGLGGWLAALGGSPYYVLAGIGLIVSALVLWRRDAWGLAIYALVLAATLGWALDESGLRGWALLPRLFGPALFAVWLLLPPVQRALPSGRARFMSARALAILAPVCLGLIGIGLIPQGAIPAAPPRAYPPMEPALAQNPALGDWMQYGNDAQGSRFSPLTQITRADVADLQLAWTLHTGTQVQGGPTYTGEVTPLKIRNALYICTAVNDIIAVDAETGTQFWRFLAHNDLTGLFASTCRGVSYFHAPQLPADAPCAERILTATTDGRLLAVDLKDGKPCQDFGDNGQVDLKRHMGDVMPGYFNVTSPPEMVGGKALVNGQITDGQFFGEPSSVVRAYDAVTGKFAWAWDLARAGVHTEPETGQNFARSEPNSWAPMAADEALGLVYVATGNGTPGYYGGLRSPEMNRYSSSIVALDIATGEPRWSFQTVHHDLWDYDVSSPPTLLDVPTAQGVVPGVLQPTKRGEMFLLDRRTGRPIAPVTERAVAISDAVGEHSAPTQPFSSMPLLAGADPSEARMWGLTPFDQMWCRIQFRRARYAGTMTPVEADRPTIVFPGSLGGMEWGGASIDKDQGLIIINTSHMPDYAQLLPRAEADARGVKVSARGERAYAGGTVAQLGTPYAASVSPFLSPLRVPCAEPPYGMINAVDVKARKLVWSRPLGTAEDSGPFGIASHLPILMGVPNIGGAVVTRGGLTFIGATQDRYLRALDTSNGALLWRVRLPAGGHATPMTYWSAKSGRQFVAIYAGGHLGMGGLQGDALLAYALPPDQVKH